MSSVEELLGDVKLMPEWVEKLDSKCPYCGGQMEKDARNVSPNAAGMNCRNCGLEMTISAPDDARDDRWDNEPIDLRD